MLTMPSERALGKLSVERTLIRCVLAFVPCSSTVLHNFAECNARQWGWRDAAFSSTQTLHDLVLMGSAVSRIWRSWIVIVAS